ncbi:MAG: divalent metal cation transporter, partial [Candidatus Daviesbacteria bacterium]|nr:divalent metal cation transporter [Candidatus Daviesbacteria bacterium]
MGQARDYWKSLGPGLTTGAADDDPSGITTYSQAGAQYGFNLLWLAGFTFPLMAVIQEMCARIGLVTGRGLAANIRQYYPKWVLYIATLLLFSANTLNIGANLGAMAQATQLLFPKVSFTALILGFTIVT